MAIKGCSPYMHYGSSRKATQALKGQLAMIEAFIKKAEENGGS